MSDDRDDSRDRDSPRDRDDLRDRENPRDRGDPRDPERLDERVEELEGRVRELRDELGRPPEGPLGLPRPPTPREMLSFTGEYAIPTAIAMLEANVRALKALQQVIRLVDPERSAVDEGRDRLQSRAADASGLTLDRLESALEDVETTIREGDLPREDEARSLLDDARRINREIRDRVESERREVEESRQRERDIDRERTDATRNRADDPADEDRADAGLDGGTTIELTDEGAGTTGSDGAHGNDGEDGSDDEAESESGDDDRAEVDVEAELRSIKDEMEDGRAASGPESDGASGPESDGASGPESDGTSGGDDNTADDSAAKVDDDSNAETSGDDGDSETNGDHDDADDGHADADDSHGDSDADSSEE